MNWNRPRADEVEAAALELKSDSIFAVVTRYSKLVPVVSAACLIAPAIRARAGSIPDMAVAFDVSTDMVLVRELTALALQARSAAPMPVPISAIMVNGGLIAARSEPLRRRSGKTLTPP